MPNIKAVKANAIQTAVYDTALQVLLRMVSFVLNALIVRWISSSVFAVMTVRLHLLYATGLLLSREAFRRASLSSKKVTNVKKLVNLVWLGALASVPLIILGGFIWSFIMAIPPVSVTQDYHIGITLVMLSIFIEVCAENPYVLSELQLWAKTKVVIEGTMQISRSLFLVYGIWFWPKRAIAVYGVSQILGSVIYTGLYYGWFAYQLHNNSEKMMISSMQDIKPHYEQPISNSVDRKMFSIAWNFFKQGWIKESLTEGEFYVMNFIPTIPLHFQGTYQVVTNLSSLAARLVFRPAEAAAYKFFAQVLERGTPIIHQREQNAEEATSMLLKISKHLLIMTLGIITFGWSYSHALLMLYGGPSLANSGTTMMRVQCFYVALLAINGITEAFTFATMSSEQLAKHNGILVLFSVLYLTSCALTSYTHGVMGFLFSNCLNMLVRIINSMRFIESYYEGSKYILLQPLMLPLHILAAFGLSFCATSLSEIYVYPTSFLCHISCGIFIILILSYLIRYEIYLPVTFLLQLIDGVLLRILPQLETSSNSRSMKTKLILLVHKFLYVEGKLNKAVHNCYDSVPPYFNGSVWIFYTFNLNSAGNMSIYFQ